jgi:hypothetical protein
MPASVSADLYSATTLYLNGDTGSVRAAINGDAGAIMAAGSVNVARRDVNDTPRRTNSFPLSAEIVPVEEPAHRAIGIGWRERDAVFDVICTVHRKGNLIGATQVAQLEAMLRALVFYFDGMTTLLIPVNTGSATFRYARAAEVSRDTRADSHELIRGVVRLTFTFTEEQKANS